MEGCVVLFVVDGSIPVLVPAVPGHSGVLAREVDRALHDISVLIVGRVDVVNLELATRPVVLSPPRGVHVDQVESLLQGQRAGRVGQRVFDEEVGVFFMKLNAVSILGRNGSEDQQEGDCELHCFLDHLMCFKL